MSKRQTFVAVLLRDQPTAHNMLHNLRKYHESCDDPTLLDAIIVAKNSDHIAQIQVLEPTPQTDNIFSGSIVGLITGAMLFGALDTFPKSKINHLLAQMYKDLRDTGMNINVMRNVMRDLQPNGVALILLYEGIFHPSVINILRQYDSHTSYASLPTSTEISLRVLMTDTVHKITAIAPLEALCSLKAHSADIEKAISKKITNHLQNDLTNIVGIDGRVEGVLKGVGIRTYSHIANASTNDLHSVLYEAGVVTDTNVATWSDQAWLASKDRWEELAELQKRF